MSSGSSPGMGAATVKRSCVRYTFTGIHCNFGCSCIYCTSPDDQIIHLAWAWWIHKRLTNPMVYKFHGVELHGSLHPISSMVTIALRGTYVIHEVIIWHHRQQ